MQENNHALLLLRMHFRIICCKNHRFKKETMACGILKKYEILKIKMYFVVSELLNCVFFKIKLLLFGFGTTPNVQGPGISEEQEVFPSLSTPNSENSLWFYFVFLHHSSLHYSCQRCLI